MTGSPLFHLRKRKWVGRTPTHFSLCSVSYSATEEVLTSEVSEATELVELVLSSAAEEVLVVLEVPLVELVLPPEQAAMLRARVRAMIVARTFFIVSFPFVSKRFVKDSPSQANACGKVLNRIRPGCLTIRSIRDICYKAIMSFLRVSYNRIHNLQNSLHNRRVCRKIHNKIL